MPAGSTESFAHDLHELAQLDELAVSLLNIRTIVLMPASSTESFAHDLLELAQFHELAVSPLKPKIMWSLHGW